MCSAWRTDHNILLKVDPSAAFIYQLHPEYLLKWNLETIPCLQNNNQPVSRKAQQTLENPFTLFKANGFWGQKNQVLCRTSIIFRVMKKEQRLGLVSSQCGYLSALSSHPPLPVSCDELIRRKYYCSLSFHVPNKAHILKQLWNFAQNPGLKAN